MVTPESIEVIPHGPAAVAVWKAAQPMYSAHRGGSADWPEHSLRAYTQAALNGFPCFEVSLARTSDGVLMCNHDSSINAVVWGGATNLPDISAMTWNEVDQYMIEGPINHLDRGPEPFLRFDELLDRYGSTRLFLIDPKSISSSFYPEILDYLDSLGGNTRFVGKWVGSNPVWSDALAARGYESWGAFYEADWATGGAGFPAEWADQWTMLGLDYTADQAHWDEILAVGKPVLAHVCPDPAAVEIGRSKGANGFQCSGVESIDPLER